MMRKEIQGKVKIIGFDADDTLWANEIYFQETTRRLTELLSPYVDPSSVFPELYHTEMQNMPLYGYGVKAFILSVIETALRITSGKVPSAVLEEILRLGKAQLSQPVELLDGVEETLRALAGGYRLVVVTKGDLLDQEKKLRESGLEDLFHHVEIMSDKNERTYRQLLGHLDISPEEFLMVGNSLRSDILPPLALGCYGVHIPSGFPWEHENVPEPVTSHRFHTAGNLRELTTLLTVS